jgi:hypothetical protein
MSFADDHCKTAADVLASARRVQALRQASYKPRPAPPPTVKAPPPPRPRVVIAEPPPAVAPAPLADDPPVSYRRISVRAIMKATADYFNLPLNCLLSARRHHSLVRARHVGMHIAFNLTQLSYPAIARAMGDRDHTTILHGKRAIERLLEAGDIDIAAAVKEITARLEAAFPPVPQLALQEELRPEDLPLTDRRRDPRLVTPWSREELEKLLRLRKENRKAKYCAYEIGRSVGAVRHRAARIGFPFSRTEAT